MGQEATGAEPVAVDASDTDEMDAQGDGTEASEAVSAAPEAALELTAEAAAAVAQAAAAIEKQRSSRRFMLFGETDEEFDERMDCPGFRVEEEYRAFYYILTEALGPVVKRAELTGIWKEGMDSLERRWRLLARRADSEG